MARDLILFPCSGNALEALDCLGTEYRAIGFVDDSPEKQGETLAGLPVWGREAFAQHPQAQVLAVPGNPSNYRQRLKLIASLGLPPERFARVIHPSARVSPLAEVGRNTLLMAGVVVTSNARIEDHVCVLPNSVVHHDVAIGEGTLVGSQVSLAGGVQVGSNAYIGTGTKVIHDLSLGEGCLTGLGSVVIRPVPAGKIVAGNPARELKPQEHGR